MPNDIRSAPRLAKPGNRANPPPEEVLAPARHRMASSLPPSERRKHQRLRRRIRAASRLKEAITETRPLVLDSLLKIAANFYVVTEWTPMATDKARKEVNKRRRHFNVSKTGFISQMGNDATNTNQRDVLVDESRSEEH